jgi:hypothetical protein
VDRRVKTPEAPSTFSSLIGQMNDLKRPLYVLVGVGGSVGPIDRKRLFKMA